jgi:cytoskeleton protein RodZ
VATDTARSFAFDTEQVCHLCGAHLDASHLEDTASGPVCLFCGMPASSPSSPHVIPADGLEVGEALRAARLQRGISLEEAAANTCIRASHLRALEDDEPPKDYPGPVYARFFLREYAEYLELDDGPLLTAFDRAVPEELIQPLQEPAVVRREPPGWAITAIVSSLILVVVLVLTHSGGAPGRPVAPAETAAAALPAAPASSLGVAHTPLRGDAIESSPATPRGPEGIHTVITTSAPCWILAVIDGDPLAGRTYPAGDTVRLRARHSIDLELGNAGGAALHVNGERFPTGADGQVARISFGWRHGELIAS